MAYVTIFQDFDVLEYWTFLVGGCRRIRKLSTHVCSFETMIKANDGNVGNVTKLGHGGYLIIGH